MKTYQSRWGYHPCDYETFLLLKMLNARYLAAQRSQARWLRWFRKKPSNRLLRRYVYDTEGRKAGFDVIGRQPEPRLCPLFCRKAEVVTHWTEAGEYAPSGRHVEGYLLLPDCGIAAAYRAARTPVSSAEAVQPLPLSPEAIRRLAGDLVRRF